MSVKPEPGKCGAKKKNAPTPDKRYCDLTAGWGTDHVGTGACRKHGGKTRTHRTKAKREEVEQQAQRMVALAGVDQDPIEHLIECLQRAKALCEVWGAMVAELDEVAEEEAADSETRGELGYERDTNPATQYELKVRSKDRLLGLDRYGQASVHPYVKELNDALDRRARFAKMCLDAGVAEKQVELFEQQIEIAHGAFEAGLAALDLDEEQKQAARKAYADRLRTS